MIINVKDRNIEIDDELAKKYEETFFEQLNTKIVALYIKNEIDKSIDEYQIKELNAFVKKQILLDIEVNT